MLEAALACVGPNPILERLSTLVSAWSTFRTRRWSAACTHPNVAKPPGMLARTPASSSSERGLSITHAAVKVLLLARLEHFRLDTAMISLTIKRSGGMCAEHVALSLCNDGSSECRGGGRAGLVAHWWPRQQHGTNEKRKSWAQTRQPRGSTLKIDF